MKNIGDYESIHSVNPLYFIIGEIGGYLEESNGNKNLNFSSTDLTKYTWLWDGIKNLIKKINDKPGEFRKDFMKIKFNSDDNLSLNKILKLHNLTVIVRSVFSRTQQILASSFLRWCL